MAKRKRIGKKLQSVETLFVRLPKQHKTEEVFVVLCEAAGLDPAKAREHFMLALSLIGFGGR